MADPVPAGSDVSAGTYKCTNCGYELQVGSTNNLPPCPSCHNGQYKTLSGGDAAKDPDPDRKLSAARTWVPFGLPSPVHASQPAPAWYAPLSPAVMSRHA